MDKVFAAGMYWREPSEKAPDFIIGNVMFKVTEFTDFLKAHADEEGQVKLSVKMSKKGTAYAELDTWEPTEKEAPVVEAKEPVEYPADDVNPDDIPFSTWRVHRKSAR